MSGSLGSRCVLRSLLGGACERRTDPHDHVGPRAGVARCLGEGELMKLINDDCFEALKALPANSVHAVVTDPPYGLSAMKPKDVGECLSAWSAGETWVPKGSGFMGKAWDAWVPPPELWREVARVLKPGGHLLVFAGSRTQDLMSVSLRLAGLEIRDTLQWLYGSGFPKSHDVSKALGKLAGAERDVLGTIRKTDSYQTGEHTLYGGGPDHNKTKSITAPATEQAKQWEGWGTALKPAYEPVILARKPLEGTVAQNTLAHGCGGINVDGCRVGESGGTKKGPIEEYGETFVYGAGLSGKRVDIPLDKGRFPANVLIDETAAQLLDDQVGSEVSRFFYTAKTSRKEREAGLPQGDKRANVHPTVKPIELMRYLVRLITPPQGTVLDPFMGSGSTGCAAALEGVDFIGIEREEEYFEIASARIAHWAGASREAEDEPAQPSLFDEGDV